MSGRLIIVADVQMGNLIHYIEYGESAALTPDGIYIMNIPIQPDFYKMESHPNNFVILSRRLRKSGDHEHAERLLKNGLKRVEHNLQNEELALLEILKELVELYEEQGKIEKKADFQKRIEALLDQDFTER